MDQATKTYLDKKFGYLNKKFGYFDDKFGELDDKFGELNDKFGELNDKLGELSQKFDKRSDQVDQRFDSMRKYIDYRFDELPNIFVTKADFEKLSSKMYEYLDAFAGVVEESGQDRGKYTHRFSAMDDKIHDHEIRIRTLETKK